MQIIYHNKCLDGFTGAWVAATKDQDAVLTPVSYGKPPPMIVDKEVVFVDFCYGLETMLDIDSQADSLTILDHHQTTIDNIGESDLNLQCVLDVNRSGAGIAWDFFHPDLPRPAIIDYVEDADILRMRYPETKAVNAFLRTVKMDLDEWSIAAWRITNRLEFILDSGNAILDRQDALIDECIEEARLVEIGGVEVWAAPAPYSLGSEMANRLIRDKGFAAYWVDKPDCRQFGLRSDGSVDVEHIAHGYGGGGHKAASGFIVDKSHPLSKV